MRRRNFLTYAGLAGVPLAAPAIARAQETFNWRMTNAYAPGAPFYVEGPGSPEDFCAKVEAMSGGRLRIQHFAAGELIPALEGFDAVQAGTVQMNAANSYFWAGRIPAAQFFTTVPFGMNFAGQLAWTYHGGGQELWDELYAPFGLKAMPMGNTGVQMTGWFREPLETPADLEGLNMRVPGIAGAVYTRLGVNTRLLPGGEIFPALERGVIDAAEFVGPYQDRRLGLQNAASYYYTTGWHEPNNVTELLINQQAWDSLPEDLQAIVDAAAKACTMESYAWCESVNAEALRDLVDNQGVTAEVLPSEIVDALRQATDDALTEIGDGDEDFARVRDAYQSFQADHDSWAERSEEPLFSLRG